jgi:O-methyltransferase involved in polyketide biosynthesis
VLAHARALLTSTPEGATAYLEADLREPDTILAAARQTLDFRQPIALILLGIMHLIQDQEEPYEIVSHLIDALPSGSYLLLSHPASDISANQAEAQKRYNERVATPQTLRSHAQVCRFFDGLQLVPPGVVYVHTWRADPDDEPPAEMVSAWGGMARKP